MSHTAPAFSAPPPRRLTAPEQRQILVYFGALILLLGFSSPQGALIGLPVSFFLKNRLHLPAHAVAAFKLVAAIPSFLAFGFGLARDVWSPFGWRDRGFMLLFGGLGALTYVVFAFLPVSYPLLLSVMVLASICSLFVVAAERGLIATFAQQHVMSGQVSALWNGFGALPGIAALWLGGLVSQALEAQGADGAGRMLFLIGALLMAGIALFATWRSRAVFDNLKAERAVGAPVLADLKRLLCPGPIYPALLIWLMWEFAPGSVTALQFHLQDRLHGTDAQWGEWNAIFGLSFLPTFLVFGLLCRKTALKYLLYGGAIVAAPQFVPVLFIRSVPDAFIAAVPMGLAGGVATAAFMTLIIRACPKGLQGVTLMLAASLSQVVVRFGDILGARLYETFGGFSACVTAITVIYVLIVPVIWFWIPKSLIDHADGPPPTAPRAMLALESGSADHGGVAQAQA
jgi:hypothetical protein